MAQDYIECSFIKNIIFDFGTRGKHTYTCSFCDRHAMTWLIRVKYVDIEGIDI